MRSWAGGLRMSGFVKTETENRYGELLPLAPWEPCWNEGFWARKEYPEVSVMHADLRYRLHIVLSRALERELLLEVRD